MDHQAATQPLGHLLIKASKQGDGQLVMHSVSEIQPSVSQSVSQAAF